MANLLTNLPIKIDTDITSFRTSSGYAQGIRVTKLVLQVGSGGASSAGNVSITKPSDSQPLYPPLAVSAAVGANTILFSEDVTSLANLNWSDFAVTGVTATGTVLWIWYRV